MGGRTAQRLNLHLWSTYCVLGALLGFGDSEKVSDLVDLYFGGGRQKRNRKHNKEVNCILNRILGQRVVSLTGKKRYKK